MKKHLVWLITPLLLISSLRADEAEENVKAALAAYKDGRHSEAIQSLEYATQLMRQAKGALLLKMLPKAPSGWTAEETDPDEGASATALFGAGVIAKRTYNRGDAYITVQIQSDSPLIQNFAMMFTNPMLIASSGAKLETINGQRMSVSYRKSDQSGEIKGLVDNRYFVTIEGSNEITREDLVAFAKAIDYSGLAALK
jgi:hypothetical protein